MIREHASDPAAPSVEEAVRAASLADLAWGPMDGKEAAAFLKVSEAQFNRLAPRLPRHKKTGLGYRYLRSEILVWLRSGDDSPEDEGRDAVPRRQRRQPDGNAESVGVVPGKKKRSSGKAVRLV